MKEFKVKQKSKDETVYTLESASAGGTSSGAVASVSKPLSVVRRRSKDNILANSVENEGKNKNEPKLNAPRNPVAHAHQHVGGGSGTHKDKSKVIPRKEKYKKSFDLAESTQTIWQDVINALSAGAPDIDPVDSLQVVMKKYRISFDQLNKLAQQNGYKNINELVNEFGELSMTENLKDSAYYHEKLAYKVFIQNPNISTENEILDLGYAIAKQDLGKGQASSLFRYEPDFSSDFVSAYRSMQKEGVEMMPENYSIAEETASIEQLQKQVKTLGQALSQAREITKSIKYDDTVLEIVSHIQELSKKYNLDQRDVAYSITQVQSAKEALVSAIYGLEEVFNDAYKSAASNLDELESAKEDEKYFDRQPANETLKESTDHEASMARSELYRNAKYGISMIKMIRPGQELEGWVESCLTKAASALDKVYHYLDYQTHIGQSIDQSDDADADVFEDSDEADTALENLMSIVEYSTKLYKMIKEGDDLEGWVFMKLTKASECVSSAKHHLEYLHFKEFGMDEEFEKSLKKSMREGREMSKQEVIKYFVSHGKTAAQGAAAYERGWHGPKDKKTSSALPAKKEPTKKWLPYKDDSDLHEGTTKDSK